MAYSDMIQNSESIGVGNRLPVWFPRHTTVPVQRGAGKKHIYARFSTRPQHNPIHGIHPVVIIPRRVVYGGFMVRRSAQGL